MSILMTLMGFYGHYNIQKSDWGTLGTPELTRLAAIVTCGTHILVTST